MLQGRLFSVLLSDSFPMGAEAAVGEDAIGEFETVEMRT